MRYTASQNKLIIESETRLRELERLASLGDTEARAEHRQLLRRNMGLEEVEAVRCFGVYKDFEGNSHDSKDFFYVANAELADMLTNTFNENLTLQDGGIGGGWWASRKVVASLDDVLLELSEITEVIEGVEADGWDYIYHFDFGRWNKNR